MNRRPVIIILLILAAFAFIAVILTSVDKKLVRKPKAVIPVKGRIAIVIDDWGYNLNNLVIAEGIKEPITCAVLPNLKNSRLVSQRLKNLGFEIILHLPMEPKEKYHLEKNTITASMNAAEVRNILNKDLASISSAKGISNHMGSCVTEDARASALIMSEAKKRNLYFLDSYVTSKSVCPLLAERMNIRFAKRNVFLDNRDDPAYIKEQITKLKELAAKNGYAIGIGHDRRNTLLALKETIPKLVKSGYKFVFVSEVAE